MRDLPEGVTHWDGPGLDSWKPWTPLEVAQRLRDVAAPWQVVGGWAIDLFLDASTRPHDDLEIAVLRPDLPVVRAALDGLVLHSVGDGQVRRLAPGAMPSGDTHQNWFLDPIEQAWRVDVMLEPGDATTWVFRRDPTISAPRDRMALATRDGVPYLAPEGVLLYKAKASREKDQADFASCLPRLDAPARAWLADALGRAHPGHEWIARL